MARASGVDHGRTGLSRLILFLTRRRLGHVPVPARIMALQPALLRGGALMELSQEAATMVPLRYKKLAQMLTVSTAPGSTAPSRLRTRASVPSSFIDKTSCRGEDGRRPG